MSPQVCQCQMALHLTEYLSHLDVEVEAVTPTILVEIRHQVIIAINHVHCVVLQKRTSWPFLSSKGPNDLRFHDEHLRFLPLHTFWNESSFLRFLTCLPAAHAKKYFASIFCSIDCLRGRNGAMVNWWWERMKQNALIISQLNWHRQLRSKTDL